MPEETPSRPVVSHQTGPHEQLEASLQRHRENAFRKPVADFNRDAFEQADAWLQQQQRPLILDSCCGVGQSSRKLAQAFPDHAVIGVDRSADRLSRQVGELPGNALLVRADLVDFWRLALHAGWRPEYHFLLYPNPYPKKKDLKLRWHGHPVFPDLLALGGQLECRSNWKLYLEEMQLALAWMGQASSLQPLIPDEDPLTPFERKYARSGHALWQLRSSLKV